MTPLNPKISFLLTQKLKKPILNLFAIIVQKHISLSIIISSNESVKQEIVNACDHLVTNEETLLPIAIKIDPFKNSGDVSITNRFKIWFFFCSIEFCFSFFFCTCFYFMFFWFGGFFFFAVIGNWEAFGYFQRSTVNIIKITYNAID